MARILIADAIHPLAAQMLRDFGHDVLEVPNLSSEAGQAALASGQFEIMAVRSTSTVTADVIAQAGPKLKAVIRAGAGVDNVDVEAATEAGVLVMNMPGINASSVAEHTLGLMLYAQRHTQQRGTAVAETVLTDMLDTLRCLSRASADVAESSMFRRQHFIPGDLQGKQVILVKDIRDARLEAALAAAGALPWSAMPDNLPAALLAGKDMLVYGCPVALADNIKAAFDSGAVRAVWFDGSLPEGHALHGDPRVAAVSPDLMGSVEGKTLGIIGYGNIGGHFAGMATALGMKVVAYRRPRNLEAVPEVVVDGVRVVGDLAELYRVAHVVSPHVPLVKEGDWPTQHMIDAKALASMPKGVIVLNVARGGIIDEAALADALRSGHVAAAALDVLEVEKGTLTSPLLGAPHAVIVPHLAASSPEVQVAAAMRLVELAQAMEIMFVDRVIPEGMTASVVNPATLPNFQSLPPSIPPRL